MSNVTNTAVSVVRFAFAVTAARVIAPVRRRGIIVFAGLFSSHRTC